MAKKISIVGAGDLGGAIARRLAERSLCDEIVLHDTILGRAQGKALDILQSGPILAFRTGLSGAATLEALQGSSIIITAGLFDGDGSLLDEPGAHAFFQALAPLKGEATLVMAEPYASRMAELAAVSGHFAPRSIVGSAPLAFAAAIRRRLAQTLECSPLELQLPILGLLPKPMFIPWSMVRLSGIPVEALVHASVLRQLSDSLQQPGRLGPYLLASAAAAITTDMIGDRQATQSVLAYLKGEYQQRNRFMVVPSRVGCQGIIHIPELDLDPVDRAAFERLRQG